MLLIILVLPLMASATIYDFTGGPATQDINGAIFRTPANIDNVGTGNIDSFVRIQAGGAAAGEKGYNTDGALEFDTKGGTFTHSLLLSSLGVFSEGGTDYYRFFLDVNETSNNPLITLLNLEFYIATVGTLTGYPALGTLVYDMGGDGIKLDYNNFSGSGNGMDMTALIPASLFGNDLTKYIYLYSEFGGDPDGIDDGFEEWSRPIEEGTQPPPTEPVPEPGTLILLAGGLICLAGYARIKVRRKSI